MGKDRLLVSPVELKAVNHNSDTFFVNFKFLDRMAVPMVSRSLIILLISWIPGRRPHEKNIHMYQRR
ncbi:hypothetical protein KDW_08460 [Dictyobacter vulcani]|uniref:Uncharacterized protein n=1 Tax=Dictyobacter vulcani TaxID=2607529 RepID=A0A5J4KCR8_9CHLR|nr:hypothetical protein [Dictyobacter vulcani]GER86684.1 hypothetical protein KDW_08460 [Dictyobacter vulcani]